MIKWDNDTWDNPCRCCGMEVNNNSPFIAANTVRKGIWVCEGEQEVDNVNAVGEYVYTKNGPLTVAVCTKWDYEKHPDGDEEDNW